MACKKLCSYNGRPDIEYFKKCTEIVNPIKKLVVSKSSLFANHISIVGSK